MTDDRELSLILDRWLSDGPTEMPDRVIDVVATGISRQRQRPAWRLDWRRYAMNTNVKLAAALVAALAVAIVGYTMLPGGSTGVGGPAPTASPAPSASPAPTPSPTPDALLNARAVTWHPFGSTDENLAVRVRVPAGWEEFPEWALLGPKGTEAPGGIGFAILMADSLYSDPCHPTTPLGDEPVGPSVDDLVTALIGHPGFEASSPTPVSLDGYSGQRLDLQLPDLGSCTGQFRVFTDASGGLYSQGSNAIWRLWILDVAGTRVVVLIDDYAGTPSADRAAAEAVVNAIEFLP